MPTRRPKSTSRRSTTRGKTATAARDSADSSDSSGASSAGRRDSPARWTFLTNHAHVLIVLAQDPSMVLREVAARIGITERAVQSIVSDLERGGALTRIREGRRNRYEIHSKFQLRHPIEAHCTVGDLVAMVGPGSTSH